MPDNHTMSVVLGHHFGLIQFTYHILNWKTVLICIPNLVTDLLSCVVCCNWQAIGSILWDEFLWIMNAVLPCHVRKHLHWICRWILKLKRPVMTTTNSSVLKGIVHHLVILQSINAKLSNLWFMTSVPCVHRCCCLCWCVVIRQNSKLFKTICPAAAGNGSSGETTVHINTFSHDCTPVTVITDRLCVYFKKPKCLFFARYQKHSINKSHMLSSAMVIRLHGGKPRKVMWRLSLFSG